VLVRRLAFACHARLLLNSRLKVDHCHVNPPTEQLIRDYLNLLSLAARDKLGFSERQSLLDRTRLRIEAECGGVNRASAVQVRRALASLGDPIALVDREVGQAGLELAKENEIGRHLLVGGGLNGSRPDREASSGRSARPGSDGQRRRRKEDSSSAPAASRNPSIVPAQRRPLDSNDAKAAKPLAGREHRREPGRGAAANETEAITAGQRGRPSGPAAVGVGVTASLMRDLGPMARANKLEFVALALLGIGGVVYPPIWLLGAVLAMPSRKWDMNDKVLGLVLPVMLVIVGTVVTLLLGGVHNTLDSYVREAWLGAERLSRVSALLGAIFLLWSLRRGRRQPKEPPWNIPHRLG
jgi:hypothetical protein